MSSASSLFFFYPKYAGVVVSQIIATVEHADNIKSMSRQQENLSAVCIERGLVPTKQWPFVI